VTAAISARAFLGTALCLLTSCSFFSHPPPLPRRAAIEPAGSGEKLAMLVQSADIIYFPSESVALDSRSESAWKLLDALQRESPSFALGWDLAANTDDHRDFLAEAGKAGAEIIALRAPAATDESPREFEPPPGDFERFSRRFSSRDVSEARMRAAYETTLLAEQFAASKIVAHFREHRSGKILVFLRRDHLSRDHGVPFFVAQKTKARQLILNPQHRSQSGPGLLARD
jgi:hypothetical protein